MKPMDSILWGKKERIITPILRIAWTGLIACIGLSAHASSILSTDGNTSFRYADSNLSADQFVVAAPNDSYISFNSFSDFLVDEPLQIFNLPSAGRPAADVIVILASNLSLSSSIEIIGPKADILILESSLSDGDIYCTACSFQNLNRITLGVADPSGFSTNMTAVGVLASVANSEVIITNLDAPAALSLEIAASAASISGTIDLNQNADYELGGVYDYNLNGDTSVGTGSVNIYMGAYSWDYEGREIIGVISSGPAISLGGAIEAPNVRILSTFPLTVTTSIDTRTDLLATSMYRGELTIVDEGVVIETVNFNSKLTVSGTLQSEGHVELRAAADLDIGVYANLEAAEVRVIANNTWAHYGKIDANSVYAAADSLENEGDILALNLVELHTDDYLFNQYGGVIKSNLVRLKSKYGIVRNGSKTPYRSDAEDTSSLLSLSSNYLDSFSMGIFYQAGVDTSSTSYVMAPDSSARIYGNDVQITATALENINPYYVHTDGAGTAITDASKLTQIVLSSEESLVIDTANYVLNSSALIYLNDDTGILSIKTALLNNERYRTEAVLDFESSDWSVEYFDPGNYYGVEDDEWWTQTENMETELAIFSPPGLIFSLGDVQVEATSSILNNTSYIEIFGDLAINSPTLSSLGLMHSNLEQTENNYWWFDWVGNQTAYGWWEDSTSYDTEIFHDASQLDTLFFVHGAVSSSVQGYFSNHDPFDDFLNSAVESYASANTQDYGLTVDLEINWEGDTFTCEGTDCAELETDLVSHHTGAVRERTIFQILSGWYDGMVGTFSAIYNEIKFW